VTAVSLAVLTVGLVMGVFAMLFGTERQVQHAGPVKPHERKSEHDPAAEPSPFFNLASVAAFGVGFGLTGYLLADKTSWPTMAQVLVAIIAGGAALMLQSALIARWAIPGGRSDQVDERYLLQGTLAHITGDVPKDGAGTLRYALDDREFELPARTLDGEPAVAGTDVVIDRVEDGVGYVELWSRVEQRL
jgi:hypothetical protein